MLPWLRDCVASVSSRSDTLGSWEGKKNWGQGGIVIYSMLTAFRHTFAWGLLVFPWKHVNDAPCTGTGVPENQGSQSVRRKRPAPHRTELHTSLEPISNFEGVR